MTILSRIQWSLIVICLSVAVLGAWYLRAGLQDDARTRAEQQARLLMAGSDAVRRYTVTEVSPLLDRQAHPGFLPQTVAAYAAIQTFGGFADAFPGVSYREAVLNPTNPSDKATQWEAALIADLAADPQSTQVTGERVEEDRHSFYLAEAIVVRNANCLRCHGKPEDAPATLLDRYGAENGFGWKLNEVVGARIVTLPLDQELSRVRAHWLFFLGMMAGLLLVLALVVGLVLHGSVTSRLAGLTLHVEAVIRDEDEGEDFNERGSDEISVLAAAMNSMRRHLLRATGRQR